MINYITTNEELTSLADAIRAKTGSSELLTYPLDFINEIENLNTGNSFKNIIVFPDNLSIVNEGDYSTKAIGLNFETYTSIGTNAFYSYTGLKTVSFPSCTTIGTSAFA